MVHRPLNAAQQVSPLLVPHARLYAMLETRLCNPEHCPKMQLVLARQRSELPSSPAALLRHINSQAYRQAQQDMLSRVSSSYEVGLSCPLAGCISILHQHQ